MCVLQPMFKPVNNLICCNTGLMWIAKRATSLFNSGFAAMLQDKLDFFFAARFSASLRRTDKGAKLENKLIYHANGVVSNGDAYTRSFLIHLYFYRALQKKNSRKT